MKAGHALLTLIVGITFGVIWLKSFWRRPDAAPAAVIAAPIGAALLGLGHWVAYDFSITHWAGDFSLIQALFNVGVAVSLLAKRSKRELVAA